MQVQRVQYTYTTKRYTHYFERVSVMVINATFNFISAILWRSVLLVEETGVRGENYRPVASH
jgi:hypothetical protein